MGKRDKSDGEAFQSFYHGREVKFSEKSLLNPFARALQLSLVHCV